MSRISHADRQAIETDLLAIEESLEALHDPNDHEGADSEVNGVMKCEGCEQRLQLRRILDHRPLMHVDRQTGARTFEWRIGIEKTEDLPGNANAVLTAIAAADPASAGRLNAIKGKLGLSIAPGGPPANPGGPP